MKRNVTLLLLALVAWGCSSSNLVTPTGGEKSLSYADLNMNLAGENVSVFFIDGRQAKGAGLRLDVDSASWIDTETGNIVKVPTSTIDKVETKNRTAGGLLGLGAGIAAGGGIGLIVGEGAAQRPGDVGIGLEVVAFTAGGAVLGGLAGTLVGASIGTTNSYEVAYDSTRHTK
jgi:hypothetical protein